MTSISAGAQRRIAVVGFDGFEGADLVDPGLTVIAQDPVQMGTLAAQILVERMSGVAPDPIISHVLPTILIERRSGRIAGPFQAR